jgi:hypothetical protein
VGRFSIALRRRLRAKEPLSSLTTHDVAILLSSIAALAVSEGGAWREAADYIADYLHGHLMPELLSSCIGPDRLRMGF